MLSYRSLIEPPAVVPDNFINFVACGDALVAGSRSCRKRNLSPAAGGNGLLDPHSHRTSPQVGARWCLPKPILETKKWGQKNAASSFCPHLSVSGLLVRNPTARSPPLGPDAAVLPRDLENELRAPEALDRERRTTRLGSNAARNSEIDVPERHMKIARRFNAGRQAAAGQVPKERLKEKGNAYSFSRPFGTRGLMPMKPSVETLG